MGKHVVITIGRQFGSGGTEIGRRLAEELGIAFYDKEILHMASEQSGIKESYFHLADERPGNKLLYKIVDGLSPKAYSPVRTVNSTKDENLFLFQSEIIRQLAEEQSFVIMGRLADYILKDRENVVKVFIHAREDYRVWHMLEYHDYEEESALKLVRKKDREREEFCRYYSGRKYRNAEDYTVCADSSAVSRERIVGMIKLAIPEDAVFLNTK